MQFSFGHLDLIGDWIKISIIKEGCPINIFMRRSSILSFSSRGNQLFIRAKDVDDSGFMCLPMLNELEVGMCEDYLLNIL